jgi:hypothetical protein
MPALVVVFVVALTAVERLLRHQGEKGLQSGSVASRGVELPSGGKQYCLIKVLKSLSLALSRHGLRPPSSPAAGFLSRSA